MRKTPTWIKKSYIFAVNPAALNAEIGSWTRSTSIHRMRRIVMRFYRSRLSPVHFSTDEQFRSQYAEIVMERRLRFFRWRDGKYGWAIATKKELEKELERSQKFLTELQKHLVMLDSLLEKK